MWLGNSFIAVHIDTRWGVSSMIGKCIKCGHEQIRVRYKPIRISAAYYVIRNGPALILTPNYHLNSRREICNECNALKVGKVGSAPSAQRDFKKCCGGFRAAYAFLVVIYITSLKELRDRHLSESTAAWMRLYSQTG